MSARRPAPWRLLAAWLIDAAPEFASAAIAAFRVYGRPRNVAEDPEEPFAVTFMHRLQPVVLTHNLLNAAALSLAGQTPGYRALGLRVVRADGAPLGVIRAYVHVFGAEQVVRVMFRPLRGASPATTALVVWSVWLTNPVWALFDQERRTLWKVVSGTRVVAS